MNKRLRPIPYPVGSDKRRNMIAHILRYTWHTYRDAVAQIVARNIEGALVAASAKLTYLLEFGSSRLRPHEPWREFMTLLRSVGPTYNTPTHEYAELLATAWGDLDGALTAFREMAQQVRS